MIKKFIITIITILLLGIAGIFVYKFCNSRYGRQCTIRLSDDIEAVLYNNGVFAVVDTKSGETRGRYDDIGIDLSDSCGPTVDISDLKVKNLTQEAWHEHSFDERSAMLVKRNGQLGIVSLLTGNEIIAPLLENVWEEDPQTGLIACLFPNGDVQFFNIKTGKTAFNFDGFTCQTLSDKKNGTRSCADDAFKFNNGICKVRTRNGYGLINTSGQFVVPDKFANIFYWSNPNYKAFVVGKNITSNSSQSKLLYGLYSKDFKMLTPCEYDSLAPNVTIDKEEYIAKKDGKTGIVSNKGKVVIPTIYDELENVGDEEVYDTAYIVKQNGKYGVIGEDYKVIIPVECGRIDINYIGTYYRYGVTFVEHCGDFNKLYDARGKLISDFCVGESESQEPGITPVLIPGTEKLSNYLKIRVNGNFGIIDRNRRSVIPACFNDIEYIGNGNFICVQRDYDRVAQLTALIKDEKR